MNIIQVNEAQKRIQPYLAQTPILFSQLLKKHFNKNVYLKLETQNPTGSFKPRPAFNAMLAQLPEARQKGIIASSSGNFAQAVAYAAAQLEVKSLIVMTESTSPYKIQRTKSLGAEVAISGDTHDERSALTHKLQEETGRVLLHPYDADATIAGDATIALELSTQLGDILNQNTVILVPVSGGGLIAGIAFAIKTLHPNCKVIGIQPQVSGPLAKSLETGKNVHVGKFHTLADALTASKLGEIPFEIIKKYVDDAILIDEDSIRTVTRFMLEEHKLVVEPAAALPIAALFANQVPYDNVICITTGGNIDLKMFYSTLK